MSVEAEHTISLSTKGVRHVVEQAWQAVTLSSAENVDPAMQSSHTVSLDVVHGLFAPRPTGQVEQASQVPTRLSSAENVDPPSQSEQTVSLLVVHAETMPLPVVQVVHAVHAVASATAENVVPSWQAVQTVLLDVEQAAPSPTATPWPTGQVAQVSQATLLFTAENDDPWLHASQTVSLVAVHVEITPSPTGHVEHMTQEESASAVHSVLYSSAPQELVQPVHAAASLAAENEDPTTQAVQSLSLVGVQAPPAATPWPAGHFEHDWQASSMLVAVAENVEPATHASHMVSDVAPLQWVCTPWPAAHSSLHATQSVSSIPAGIPCAPQAAHTGLDTTKGATSHTCTLVFKAAICLFAVASSASRVSNV